MIIPIAADKATDKGQHGFMIKALEKLKTDRAAFKTTKIIYDKPAANIIANGKTKKKHFF